MRDRQIFIGEAATLLGVCAATLRTWDGVGKLVPAGRTEGGRRFYTESQLKQFMKETPDARYGRLCELKVTYTKVKHAEVEEV